MKLRTRLVVLQGTVMVALLLSLYAVSTLVVQRGFQQVEEGHARRDVDRVLRAIKGRQNALLTSVTDWATWDDIYGYVRNRNEAFAKTNLTPVAFKGLQVHALLIVDVAGKKVWGGAVELEASRELPVPEGLVQLAQADSPLTRLIREHDRASGVVWLKEGPMVVAAGPIMTSKGEGPPRGTLIMGRRLDAAEVQRMADDLQLQLSLFCTVVPPDQPLLGDVLAALAGGSAAEIRVLDEDIIAGYGLVRDLFGKPVFLVQVDVPRDIHAQGVRTSYIFTALLLGVGAGFGFLTTVLLKRGIIARLEHLGNKVSQINLNEDLATPISLPGSDELSALADDINRMLVRVVDARRATAESQQQYQALFREMLNGLALHEILCDTHGQPVDYRFLAVNPAFERMTGLKAETIVGRTVLEVLPQTERSWIETYGRVALTGEPVLFEHYSGVFDKHFEVVAYRPAPGRFACIIADVTRRTRTELTLRESEQRFRTMFERHRGVMLLIDPATGTVVDANPAAAEFYGYSRENLCGRNVTDINCLPQHEVAEAYHRAHRENQNRFVFPHRLASGAVRTVEVYSSPVDVQGRTLLFSIVHDITEREAAQTALQQSRERLQLALESARMGSWDWSLGDNTLIWDEFMYQLFGVRPDTFSSQWEGFFAAVLAEDRPAVQAAVTASIEGHADFETEYRVKWPDGAVRDIAARGEVYRDQAGKPVRMMGVCWDITRRKQMEESLRQSEERFRLLFEGNRDAIFWADAVTGILTHCNAAAETLTGRSRTQLVGQPQTILHPPEEKERYLEVFRDYASLGQNRRIEGDVIREDGSRVQVEITSSLAATGGHTFLQGIFRDITDRKQAEAAMLATLEEKTALLKEVHHRVKNNLQIISSLLGLEARQQKDQKVLDAFRNTQDRVRSMALLHEMLYRSKNLARIDLSGYVQRLCEQLFRAIGGDPSRVRLECRCAAAAEVGMDQAVPCGLIISELVSNALKYAFPEGRSGRITVELAFAPDQRMVLTVADDGVGLPAGLDPAHASTLGLHLVSALTGQLMGTLEVERGRGTAFHLTFLSQTG